MTTTTLSKTAYDRPLLTLEERDHALHLSGIGAWYQIGGVLMLAAAAVVPMLLGGLGLFGSIVLGGLGLVSFGIGHGLRNHMGWARIAAGVLIMIGFLGQANALMNGQVLQSAIGVAWNIAVLWALFGECGNVLFASGPRHGPEGPFYRSPFFYLPFLPLAVALMMIVGAMAM